MSRLTSEEQAMLVDSAGRWLEGRPAGDAEAYWRGVGEMGWLAMALPESAGGLPSADADICLLAEAMGRHLAPDLYGPCGVQVGACLSAFGATLAPGAAQAVASGELRLAVAAQVLGQGPGAPLPLLRAEPAAEGWTVSGRTGLLPGAAGAQALLVLAELPGGLGGLFWVERATAGVSLNGQVLIDGGEAGGWALAAARLPASACLARGELAALSARLRQARRAGALAACAQAVGTMARAYEITRDYTRQRQQFGQPIAAHQVIQHRLVDLAVEIEEVRALVAMAAEAGPGPGDLLAGAALAQAALGARHVWEEAIQLHGAIGMTEEYVLGAHVRRLALFARAWGDEHQQMEQVAALSLAALEPETDDA